MLIQSLEQKTRLAMMTVIITVSGCVIICIAAFLGCYNMIENQSKDIYVIDGEIPFLAERTKLESNFRTEALAHINLFHQFFFNLPPDDKYIEYSLGKAMYLADASAMKQKMALDENAFYSNLISSSAVSSVMCDSIQFDKSTREFKYYGIQTIKRRTNSIKRTLITSGVLESVPRSDNNPHGLIITKWRTLENKELTH